MNKSVMIVSVFLAGLAACSGSLDVVVNFDAVTGLQQGDAVMLDDKQIGKVAKIQHVDQRTRAVLALDPDRAGTLTSNAAAMVVARNGTHIVEIYNSATGSGLLTAGSELFAINSNLEFLAWRAGETLDQANKQLGDAFNSLQEYFSSPEWEQQKRTLQDELTALEQAVGHSTDQVRRDLEALLGSLEDKSMETAKQLEQHYQALKDDLSELGKDLAKQGQENLLPALEEILSIVRDAIEQYQHQQNPPANQKRPT